jgi:hypothetical protein
MSQRRRRPPPVRRRRRVGMVLCAPAGSGARVLPGTPTRACHRCGRAVWVSRPTVERFVAAGLEMQCICHDCERPDEFAADKVTPMNAAEVQVLLEMIRLKREDA